jgi:hypothetical protein
MNTKLKKNKNKNKNKIIKEQFLDKPENLCDSKNECFICLEIDCDNEIPIKLNESTYYLKKCDCNVWVHNFCLDKWYSTSYYICPICREYIFEDMYQYHTNEEDINQENRNEEQINQNIITNTNNSQISFFIIIISKMKKKDRILLLLILTGFLYFLLIKQTQKETGYAY